jgi:hypothetical protein
MRKHYNNWRDEEFDCPKCKWHGPGSALSLGDYTLDYAERVCPACKQFITVVLHPTIAESRANRDKVSEWDRAASPIGRSGTTVRWREWWETTIHCRPLRIDLLLSPADC